MESKNNGVAKEFSHIWTCYLSFEQLSRTKGEKLGDFVCKWQDKMATAQSAGCQYSDVLLACKLLEKSNLGTNEIQTVVTLVENSSSGFFSEVLARLDDLTRNDFQVDEGQLSAIDFIKVESEGDDPFTDIKEEPSTEKPLKIPEIQMTEDDNFSDFFIAENETNEIHGCLHCNAEVDYNKLFCKSCASAEEEAKDSRRKNHKVKKKQRVKREQRIAKKRSPPDESKFLDTSFEDTKAALSPEDNLETESRAKFDIEKGESHPCDICGKVFDRQKKLLTHLKRHHVPLILQERQDKEVKMQCDKCGKNFLVLSRLQKHHARCGKEPIKKYIGNQSTTCHICGKSFRKHYGLRVHMVHHTKEKSYKCEFCPAAFGYESGLNAHRKKHLENKSLECPKCSKIFTCEVDLRVHVRQVHPKEHRFRCGQCSYTSNIKSHFDRHVLSHTSVQPFKCNLCSKVYKDLKSVKRHIWVYHKMERIEKDKVREYIGVNVENDA